MKKIILALSFMFSGLSMSSAQNVPVTERQINRVNVTSARLRLTERTENYNQYAIRVTAQYPNSCFAPNANQIRNRIIFNADYPQNNNRVNVQVFELPNNRNCPEIYQPVNVVFEIRSVQTDPRTVTRVFVNGIRAR